ncbi:MAG: hypothetical protein HQL70_00410 [Magnetococcales bacterium]|nr:hypothetical protein [Magnetococcales bacterium]
MNIFGFGLFLVVSLLSFLPSSILMADGRASWSYGSGRNVDAGPDSKPAFNPWTGEMSGPKAKSQAEQFQYGEERERVEPITLDELYPKQGDAVKGQRPWGKVPKQFQNQDSDSYGYSQRKTKSRYPSDTKQWPDSNHDESDLKDNSSIDRFPPTYQQYRQGSAEKYFAPQRRNYRRGYGDEYPPSSGPRFNDHELDSDGWNGVPSSYRNYNYLPRY